MPIEFPEGVNMVPAFSGVVADMDTDQTGDVISLKDFGKVRVWFIKGAGTAGDDPTLTLQECTAVDASGAVALADIDTYWIKQAATALTAVTAFTKTTQTAASTIAFSAVSAEQVLVAFFDVQADHLSAGFDCIRVNVALGASGGAQYGAVLYELLEPRYRSATTVDALTD